LAAGYTALPPYEDGQHIDDQRRPLHAMLASVREQVTPYLTVDVEDVSVPGPAGDLTLRIYRPRTPSTSRPGIYLIHGGAMVLGNLDFDHLPALMLCEITGAVIVSVDYRLAPEHPYPAALDDCIAGLRWMGRHATILEINEDRLAMFGLSAGGGLALATALRVRDEGGPDLCFVMAPYPMIDDRPHLAAQDLIALAWEPYLGVERPTGTPPHRAKSTSPDSPRPSSTSATRTCSCTRRSISRLGWCRRVCLPSCTSTQGPTTRRRSSIIPPR
jgi:acetyl esterase/lipase